ncbi:MAG: DNA gyrase inhibitor YacG [Aestuariivirga sp.]
MSEPVRLRPRKPCPVCSKPSQQKFHPFCSSRCAQVDLNRWLGGQYAIPAEDAGDPEKPDSEPD